MPNNRVYYAIQQVAFSDNADSTFVAAHGVQSVGITTNFNLDQVFELGQLAIYENIEGIPDVEVTMSKVLDGYIPLYCLATQATTSGPELVKRTLAQCKVQLGIWDETYESAGEASASAGAWVEMSGLYVSSLTYNFPVDGNFSEDLTLVGNSKIWGTGQNTNTLSCDAPYYPTAQAGAFGSNDDAPIGSGGVNRRQDLIFATTAAQATGAGSEDYSVLPQDIDGVGSDGQKTATAHPQSITVSADVGREDLFELGALSPYAKTATLPIEVTCDIETTTVSGDLVTAIDACATAASCIVPSSLTDRKIRIATCEGLRIYLGDNNKLASVTYGGGDAGGGNVSVTYSYSTFNDFTVLHSGDTTANGGSTSGATWWSTRSTYLT